MSQVCASSIGRKPHVLREKMPSDDQDEWFYTGGILITHAAAVVLVALHLWYFLTGRVEPIYLKLGWISPVLLILAFAYLWRWLSRNDVAGTQLLRLSGWYIGGIFLLEGAFLATIASQVQLGATIVSSGYTTLSWATGGGIIGLLVGIYDADRQHKAKKAKQAQRRQATLIEQVLVLVRLLRHNVRTQSNLVMASLETNNESGTEWGKQGLDRLIELSEKAGQLESLLSNPDKRNQIDLAATARREANRIKEETAALTVETDFDEVPAVSAHPLIDMAIEEVLRNAVEHNDSDTPVIKMVLRSRVENGTTYVHLEIADNGPGIPESEQLAFDGQLEEPLNHSSSIGLWFIAWIVRTSDGIVSVRDNEPTGAVISIQCPAAS